VDDLAGNVAEWVEAGSMNVVRGGSFEDFDPASVGSLSTRVVDAAAPSIGFRCAADP
jgi:formylglycine-generating enzyme required for sulfatase activity